MFPLLCSSLWLLFGLCPANRHLSCIAGTKPEHSVPGQANAEQSEMMTCWSLLGMSWSMHPSLLLALSDPAAYLSLILNLLSTRSPRSLSTKLLPSQTDSRLQSWVTFFQVQHFTLVLVELHEILWNSWTSLYGGFSSPLFQTIQIFLQSASPFLSQFGTMDKLCEGTLDPIFQITCKDNKQHWAQYRSLGNPICGRLSLWKGTLCHHPVGAAFQPNPHSWHWSLAQTFICCVNTMLTKRLQEWSTRQELSKDFKVWSFHQPKH